MCLMEYFTVSVIAFLHFAIEYRYYRYIAVERAEMDSSTPPNDPPPPPDGAP